LTRSTRYIWLIILSAVIIAALANIGLFNHFYKLYRQSELSAADLEQFQFVLKIGSVGVIIELIMLIVFAFYNYRWKDRWMSNQDTFLIVLSNVILLLLFVAIKFLIFKYVTKTHPNQGFTLQYILEFLINHSLVLCIATVAPYLLLKVEKARELENKLIQLREEKLQAELATLKEQISPHFLFNTLSTLSAIVRKDTKKKSLEFIDGMAKTYRYSLSSSKSDLVLLKEELAFVESYAFLLKKRFGPKLVLSNKIHDSILGSKIPPMSIQLLIENAVRHNIATTENPLKIELRNDQDYIAVENTLNKKDEEGAGTGLINLKNRYSLLIREDIRIYQNEQAFIVKLPIIE
jgi:sensor histidine kinase YesM